MDDKYDLCTKILKEYNQEHLLMFYDELTSEQKELLLTQILFIDFEEIVNLYNNSYKEDNLDNIDISPLSYTIKENLSEQKKEMYTNLGAQIIKDNSYAVITMAGGQGSRLGYRGPKGTYELDLIPKKSLFEIQCENLKIAQKKYKVTIPWFIMTSTDNYKATIKYFEKNDYFDYPKDEVHFFIQDNLPLINTEGKLFLSEPFLVKQASNGNGNIFNAIKRNNVIKTLLDKNIKWIFIGGIDNVLLNTVDPLFLGLTIHQQNQIGCKTIFKEYGDSNEWVFCKVNGQPSIYDCNSYNMFYSDLKDENGNYLYRDLNIVSQLFSIDAIQKLLSIKLPYHRSYKKNTFINEEGMKQVPSTPNSFKFENFIFDSFKYFDDITLLRINKEEEFAPIKDFTSQYNPDTAKDLYLKYFDKRRD